MSTTNPRSFAPVLLAAATMAAACAPAGTGTPAPSRQATNPVQSGMLLSPDSLRILLEHAESARPVVLHVARARTEFETARIPGARFLPLDAILVQRDGLPNELPAVHVLDSVFTSLGVGDDSRVVLYGEPLAAARAFFTLDVLGHGGHVAVLDGALPAWRLAGNRVASGPTDPAPVDGRAAVRFTPRHAPERVVDAEWVAVRAGEPGIALIDARPAEEYRGVIPGEGIERGGHIPGAASLFWKQALVSDSLPRLHDVETLRKLFVAAGAEPGDTVVSYCRTGVQASHVYFVARYLGYTVRMYDGSFVDWTRVASRAVER